MWLDGYIAAWRANDGDAIGLLFSTGAVYGFRPWEDEGHTMRGREAIVASWLESPDDPESWDAHYEPFVVEGDRAVAVGWSRYAAAEPDPERLYHNVFLLHFVDGLCDQFHELFMLERR